MLRARIAPLARSLSSLSASHWQNLKKPVIIIEDEMTNLKPESVLQPFQQGSEIVEEEAEYTTSSFDSDEESEYADSLDSFGHTKGPIEKETIKPSKLYMAYLKVHGTHK